MPDVSCVKPAIVVNCARGGFRVIEVTCGREIYTLKTKTTSTSHSRLLNQLSHKRPRLGISKDGRLLKNLGHVRLANLNPSTVFSIF